MGLVDLLTIYLRLISSRVTAIISTCIVWIPVTYLLYRLIRAWIRHKTNNSLLHLRRPLPSGKKPLLVGFFHPYCNAGGGGERVLWIAIRALQRRYDHIRCIIYTGDINASRDEILERARQRFNIVLPRAGLTDIHFAFLQHRLWVEASRYPYFTLLGQSLGSLVLGWEALLAGVPDVYFDTMGYAFTVPLFRYFGGCITACYVHYPTISTDMLDRVAQRHSDYNNAARVSRSAVLSQAKLFYYRMFAWAYGLAGRRCDLVLVNSSWTQAHVLNLWRAADRTFVVYPPCDVDEFLSLPLVDHSDSATAADSLSSPVRTVVSVGQFRPEKDHRLQLAAFSKFLHEKVVLDDSGGRSSHYRLVLIGGCRNEEDETRVNALREFAGELGISESVEFRLNVSFDELKCGLREADVGLHTMWNEHFGISVVECMAAGTIILAHNSGGPKLDIVVKHNGQRTGFLASDVDSYAAALDTIFRLSTKERMSIRQNARDSVKRFSDSEFEQQFIMLTESLFIAP